MKRLFDTPVTQRPILNQLHATNELLEASLDVLAYDDDDAVPDTLAACQMLDVFRSLVFNCIEVVKNSEQESAQTTQAHDLVPRNRFQNETIEISELAEVLYNQIAEGGRGSYIISKLLSERSIALSEAMDIVKC